MPGVEKLSVALTQEMTSTMRALVASGEYASASEVMREAMREWMERRADRARAMERLGQLWDEGVAGGPAEDGEAVFARLRARFDLSR